MVDLLVGVAVGHWLARRRGLLAEWVEALCTLPMVLPPTVLGWYLLVLIGRDGPVGRLLEATFGVRLVFTWQAAVLAAALVGFPLVVRSARAAFAAVDPELEAAARVLGLGRRAVFWRVSLPLAWRGCMAGVLLAFARSMGEFGATLMVAGSIPGRTQTLSVAVYEAVQAGRDELAAFLVLLVSITALAVLLAAGRLAPAPATGSPLP